MDMNERMSTIRSSLLIKFIMLICSFGTIAFKKEKENRKFILSYNRNEISFLRVRMILLDRRVVKEESFDIPIEEIKGIDIEEEKK